MTPLEAARRLAKSGFTPWEDSCHLKCEMCGEDGAGEDGPFPHAEDCPWLLMPQIVAALEAYESNRTAKLQPYRCDGCGEDKDGSDRQRRPRAGVRVYCADCRDGTRHLASKRYWNSINRPSKVVPRKEELTGTTR